jgi:hypothetical protein
MSVITPEYDRFCPFRGYEDVIKDIGRTNWFAAVSYTTLARNAYYQGFITEYERTHVVGKGVFTEDGCLKWIHDLPGKPKGPYPIQELTKERIEMIYANHLLGLSDGDTGF